MPNTLRTSTMGYKKVEHSPKEIEQSMDNDRKIIRKLNEINSKLDTLLALSTPPTTETPLETIVEPLTPIITSEGDTENGLTG